MLYCTFICDMMIMIISMKRYGEEGVAAVITNFADLRHLFMLWEWWNGGGLSKISMASNLLGYRSKHYIVIEFLYLLTELSIKHIFIIDHSTTPSYTAPNLGVSEVTWRGEVSVSYRNVVAKCLRPRNSNVSPFILSDSCCQLDPLSPTSHATPNLFIPFYISMSNEDEEEEENDKKPRRRRKCIYLLVFDHPSLPCTLLPYYQLHSVCFLSSLLAVQLVLVL